MWWPWPGQAAGRQLPSSSPCLRSWRLRRHRQGPGLWSSRPPESSPCRPWSSPKRSVLSPLYSCSPAGEFIHSFRVFVCFQFGKFTGLRTALTYSRWRISIRSYLMRFMSELILCCKKRYNSKGDLIQLNAFLSCVWLISPSVCVISVCQHGWPVRCSSWESRHVSSPLRCHLLLCVCVWLCL